MSKERNLRKIKNKEYQNNHEEEPFEDNVEL